MKLQQLTFTRYIAALTVIFFHFGDAVFPANHPWWGAIVKAGPIAVSYFFVLSGFIMAIAYYKRDEPFNKWQYWLARFARIYPIYLLALGLMIAANFSTEGSDPITVLLSLSMLQAWVPGYAMTLNSPGWSLSVEAFFYLLFPLLLLVVRQRQLSTLLLVGIALWFISQGLQIGLQQLPSYAHRTPLHEFIFYHPLMHVSTFILGFVFGVHFCKGKFNWLAGRWNGLALLLLCKLLVLVLAYEKPVLHALHIKGEYYNNGLLVPLFIAIIALLATNTGWTARLFSMPLLVLLGEASYSIYILQRPIYGLYERLLGKHLAGYPELHFYLFVVALTALAVLLFKFFETPARYFINSLYSSSEKSSQHYTERTN